MQPKHFDVIILGDSLASRLAGALLAKGGRRVLTFEETAAATPAWLFPSLHLERILERLDGTSCLDSPCPFQVITADSRLTLGTGDLADELRREFPGAHAEILRLLEELRQSGERLEETLLASGGLPLTGLGSRLRFLRRRWRRGLGRAPLDRPIAGSLQRLAGDETRTACATLLEGLSLTPLADLPAWVASFLWNGAARDQRVDSEALGALLRERYHQFHGQSEPFARLKSLAADGGLTLDGGGRCRAEKILIGSSAGARLAGVAPSLPEPMTFSTKAPLAPLPPLLAEQVFVSGPLPARLAFRTGPEGTTCRVECAATPQGDAAGDRARALLTSVLPFANPQLQSDGPGSPAPPPGRFPGRRTLVRSGRLLDCHDAVLPALGASGAALTATTVASYLLRTGRRR